MTTGFSVRTREVDVLEWRQSMWRFLKTRGVELVIVAIALTALIATPAWAGTVNGLPGPAAGLLAGGAIIGTLVIAKMWRRK